MSKGNGKHPGGRPTKYKPEYCKQIIDFFDYDIKKEIRFLSTFSESIDVSRDTLLQWRNKHEEFSLAYKRAKQKMIDKIVSGGLRNVFNSGVTCFTLKNIAGWRDKTEVDHKNTGGTNIVLVTPKERLSENRVKSLSI